MDPAHFPESNTVFGPPEGMSEGQVGRIHAYTGTQQGGGCDGANITITAWKPTAEELADLVNGGLVYMVMFQSDLPPHLLTTKIAG